jgi:molybdopterin-containing oxidoreductase family iron-sulfur binding subunit
MTMADSTVKRRVFLQVLGAGAALAGCSERVPPERLVPYVNAPENGTPGKPLFYRTVCRECSAGCGVTARTREGRVVKLEGNPDDPIGRGALCARGQGALQRLYAPARLKGPMRRVGGKLEPIGWDEALALAAQALGKGSVRLLTRPEPGSAGAVQRAFLEKLGEPKSHRVVLDPLDPTALRAAGKALFDRPELPSYDLGAARMIVSLGAEFLEAWVSPVELARGLAAGRGKVDERSHFAWVGPRLSLTGASADEWVKTRPGGELATALGLLRWIADPANKVAALAPEAPTIFAKVAAIEPRAIEEASGLPWARIAALGAELAKRRPSALLAPGVASSGVDALYLAIATQLLNHLLGNLGRTVSYGLDPLLDPPATGADIRELLADLGAGKVAVLLIHHADPVGALPGALGAASAIGQVPFVVSFSDHIDATSELAHLVLPDHHALESFGDVSARRGVVTLSQAAMVPLGDTRSMPDTLIALAAKLGKKLPWDGFYAFTKTRDAANAGGGDADVARRAAQQRGGYFDPAKPEPVTLNLEAVPPFSLASRPLGELTLVPFATALRADGRTDTPWLREVPDALSGIAWVGWVELGKGVAVRLGVTDGDLVTVRTDAGSIELPAVLNPGLHDDAVAVPLGDKDTLSIVPATIDVRSGALAWAGAKVELAATGRRPAVLARADANPFPAPRDVLRTVSAAHPTVPEEREVATMTRDPVYPNHRWGMTIDLDRCTGCQACVVACYAENNVPVMGPDGTANGRNMAWINLQRYATRGPEEVSIDLLPVLCQQCDNAPCETVCPVEATYHTNEGLNAQVYNRCVGTRYCSNNCPYKARVFNWLDPKFQEPLDEQLNPDVNVRMRGVMEKCTFCIQRIRLAEGDAKTARRPLADGEVTTACAQTCPSQAIVFGDLKDPSSKVARSSKDPRGFHLLAELNTRPAITYLARVRKEAT